MCVSGTGVRYLCQSLLFILIAVMVLPPAFAAQGVPQILNYQGNLTDAQGNPVNAVKTMSFRIYPALGTPVGQALWVSGDVPVSVVKGVFSVNLGEAPQQAFPTGLFSDDTRFLGVTVDGTELQERKRLVSVPYALNAATNGAINFNAPEGFLINGKIVPSVASNNLTVALKTTAGNDPSVSDPIYVMIGGTMRSLTSALSCSANAGQNYCNAGSAELATKEVDYFVYLTWDSVAVSVQMIMGARIPYATVISDFAWSNTNEKGFLGTTATNTSTDSVVNIGRFAATLSTGTGYSWSVPTFTTKNLIQRPVYETRWLDWVPKVTGYNTMTEGATTVNYAKYKVRMENCEYSSNVGVTFTTTANPYASISTPFNTSNSVINNHSVCSDIIDTQHYSGAVADLGIAGSVGVCKYNQANFSLGPVNINIIVSGNFPI